MTITPIKNSTSLQKDEVQHLFQSVVDSQKTIPSKEPKYKRTHTKPFSYFRDNSPVWMTEEALYTLIKGYLQEDESPNRMYLRLAECAASHYPDGHQGLTQGMLRKAFEYIFLQGWLSPATPVAANMGTGQHIPVSCYSIQVQNNIKAIIDGIAEAAVLTKHGGGLGIDLSNLVGMSNVTVWAQGYDWMARAISQGKFCPLMV